MFRPHSLPQALEAPADRPPELRQRAAQAALALVLSAWVAAPLLADTVTSTANSGPGSLRDTIAAASPGATIDFAVTGVIVVTPELAITKNLTIRGPGAQVLALDGNGASRVLHIAAGTTVTLSGLTIRNGMVRVLGPAGADGAPGSPGDPAPLTSATGAGILSEGNLTIRDCVIADNHAFAQGGAGGKGGDGAAGTTGSAGGAGGAGGPASAAGGGIFNQAATLLVVNTTFVGNTVSANGGKGGSGGTGGDGTTGGGGNGGRGGDAGGATQSGGALSNSGLGATLVNCTVTGNDAGGGISGAGGRGGNGGSAPIGGEFAGPGGNGGDGGTEGDLGVLGTIESVLSGLTLEHVTLAQNRALPSFGGLAGGGGARGLGGDGAPAGNPGVQGSPGTIAPPIVNLMTLSFAPNIAVDRSVIANPVGGANCGGFFTSGGYNVSFSPSDTSCDALLTSGTDRPGQDPQLAALALNSPGSTPTMAIPATSAAFNAIPSASCTAATDQRGIARPQGFDCDSGAFELEQAVAQVPALSSTGLAVLLLLLAGCGMHLLRRR